MFWSCWHLLVLQGFADFCRMFAGRFRRVFLLFADSGQKCFDRKSRWGCGVSLKKCYLHSRERRGICWNNQNYPISMVSGRFSFWWRSQKNQVTSTTILNNQKSQHILDVWRSRYMHAWMDGWMYGCMVYYLQFFFIQKKALYAPWTTSIALGICSDLRWPTKHLDSVMINISNLIVDTFYYSHPSSIYEASCSVSASNYGKSPTKPWFLTDV